MTQKEKSLYIKKDEVLDVIDRYIANEVARRKRKISEGKCSDWMKERSQNEIDGAEFLKAFLVGYLRGEDDTVYPERREQTETIDNFTKVYKEK